MRIVLLLPKTVQEPVVMVTVLSWLPCCHGYCVVMFTVLSVLIKTTPGARALKSIVETTLLDAMFEIPGSDICHVQVTSQTVLDRTDPVYTHTPPPPPPPEVVVQATEQTP